jgi:hypothetical protein
VITAPVASWADPVIVPDRIWAFPGAANRAKQRNVPATVIFLNMTDLRNWPKDLD